MEIDPEYVSQLRRTVQEQAKKNHEKQLERQKAAAAKEWSERYPFSEGDFYFVAGQTSNGVPYGITWEEARKQGLIEDDEPDGLLETTELDIDKWYRRPVFTKSRSLLNRSSAVLANLHTVGVDWGFSITIHIAG